MEPPKEARKWLEESGMKIIRQIFLETLYGLVWHNRWAKKSGLGAEWAIETIRFANSVFVRIAKRKNKNSFSFNT